MMERIGYQSLSAPLLERFSLSDLDESLDGIQVEGTESLLL